VKAWIAASVLAVIAMAVLSAGLRPPGVMPPRGELMPPHPTTSERDDACLARYRAIREDGVIDVRIVFGYKDVRPARFVGDRYERLMILSYLMLPCPPGLLACGFSRDPHDAELFTRPLVIDGRRLKARVRVVHASAGPDDRENRNRDFFQAWQTQRARMAFLDGIREADAVFYVGHSRDGGGPDFAPPRLGRENHVDYAWYRKRRPGEKAMLAALTAPREGSLHLLGLLSCASSGFFTREIRAVAPRTGLLTSDRLLYYSDSLRNLLGALSALLGGACGRDFKTAVQARDPLRGAILNGFFENNN